MIRIFSLLLLLSCGSLARADKETLPPPRIYADFELSDYKYPAQAKTTTIVRSADNRTATTAIPYLGVQLTNDLRIAQVDLESPAARNGLRSGDAVTSVDDKKIANLDAFRDALMLRVAGDKLKLKAKRDGKELEFSIALAPVSSPFNEKDAGGRRGGSWDNRAGGSFRRDVYRLAVLLVGYPDVAINSKITAKDWEKSFFSKGAYLDKSVTGQQVYGSVLDYYQEQSCGQLRVEGKVFETVHVSKKRIDYMNSTTRTALLSEAIECAESPRRARGPERLRRHLFHLRRRHGVHPARQHLLASPSQLHA